MVTLFNLIKVFLFGVLQVKASHFTVYSKEVTVLKSLLDNRKTILEVCPGYLQMQPRHGQCLIQSWTLKYV